MKNNKGFTLLELSIVMLITGFLTVGFLGTSRTVLDVSKQNDTKNKLKNIENAINGYIIKYGKLPCPAGIKLSIYDSEYGKEICVENATKGVRNLNTGDIIVGSLPIDALNLESKFSYDGWKNKFVYAVVKEYANNKNNLYINNIENAKLINNKYIYSVVSTGRNQHYAYYYKSNKMQKGIKIDTVGKSNSYDEMKNNTIIDISDDKDFDDIIILQNKENLLQNLDKFDQMCIIDINNVLMESDSCGSGYMFSDVKSLKYKEKLYSNNVNIISKTIDVGDGEIKTIKKIKQCIIECTNYGRVIAYLYTTDI